MAALYTLCIAESSTPLVTSSFSSTGRSCTQETQAHDVHNLSVVHDSTVSSDVASLSSGHGQPPAGAKKRRRGRPPIHKWSDKRKAMLKEVGVP